eukprot:1987908-Amphidinium_carterae.1
MQNSLQRDLVFAEGETRVSKAVVNLVNHGLNLATLAKDQRPHPMCKLVTEAAFRPQLSRTGFLKIILLQT